MTKDGERIPYLRTTLPDNIFSIHMMCKLKKDEPNSIRQPRRRNNLLSYLAHSFPSSPYYHYYYYGWRCYPKPNNIVWESSSPFLQIASNY